MKHDYREEMKQDIISMLKEDGIIITHENREELEQSLYDDMFISDAITGNASGSYYFDAMKSREAVQDDGMDYFREACKEFCIPAKEIGERFLNEDWEYIDVTIRCYLLGQVLYETLEELEDTAE